MSEEKRLLLVDDDEVYCLVLMKSLLKRGFQVTTANSTEDANKVIEAQIFDYAVLDLRLGNSSGLPLIEPLLAQNPDTRIVVLTGYASIATAIESIKLGAVHYLNKPTTADEIVRSLDKTEGDASTCIEEQPVSLKRMEWEHLQKVLVEHDGNISAAARAMGMHRRTLQRKLQKKPVAR